MWTKYEGTPKIPNYSQCLIAVSMKSGERALFVGVYLSERDGFAINSMQGRGNVLLCAHSPEFYYHVLDERLQVDETSVNVPLCIYETEPDKAL